MHVYGLLSTYSMLNISLAMFHTNKPAGTCGLTPTPAYFNIVPSLCLRSQPRTCLFALVDIRNARITFASTGRACSQMNFHCTNNNFIFMCKNELEYVNYHFFFFWGGGGCMD